ncbi:hypothetical protein SUGI_1064140 [Cryptomeria japonica]|nr:hypothetical protein SUGI_1064140 [Cryptomeria japonica]
MNGKVWTKFSSWMSQKLATFVLVNRLHSSMVGRVVTRNSQKPNLQALLLQLTGNRGGIVGLFKYLLLYPVCNDESYEKSSGGLEFCKLHEQIHMAFSRKRRNYCVRRTDESTHDPWTMADFGRLDIFHTLVFS